MKVFAYSYSDPVFESVPDASVWGQDVDRVYQDLGDRQQLQQLLHDCQIEPPDCVLVRRFEELGDSVDAVNDCLIHLESLNVPLISTEESTEADLKLSDHPLQRSDVLSLLKTIQQQQHRRQIKRGHARNRIKAIPPPGKAPYGYRRGKDRYILDRTTAPVVKDFFENFLLYGSLRGSVRYLQKKYNKKISVSTGRRWLTNLVYRGDLVYQNGEVIRDTHAAIISRDEAAQVDRLLRRNRRMPSRTASAPRSLSGLVTCGTCHSPMTISRVTAARKQQEYLYLRATACPNQPKCQAIPYADVLTQTIDRICQDLPRAVAQAPMPDLNPVKQALLADIEAKQAILDQLPTLTANGILDSETANLRAYKLRTEIADLHAKLAQLPPVSLQAIAQVASIPQFWLDLSETERRFYFREFIRQIQIIRDGKNWTLQLLFIF